MTTTTTETGFGSGPRRWRGSPRGVPAAALAALITYGALCAPGSATEVGGAGVSGTTVLEAADHAELRAAISAAGVIRIALVGDRIARVVRGPQDVHVEHDPARGDLYLHPLPGASASGFAVETGTPFAAARAAEPGASPAEGPAVLFVGTEKGFTYRLTLVPAPGGPAQILIRNAQAAVSAAAGSATVDERIGALVRLVRAAARREPLAGYAIHAGGALPGLTVIETWRGPRFSALVFEAGPSASEGAQGAAGLAGTIGGQPGIGRVAAAWLGAPGTGPSGGRLAVAVRENAPAGASR